MRQQYSGSKGVSSLAPGAGAWDRGVRFAVSIASCDDDVREAQRLRHRVFVEEMGARLAGSTDGVEADRFDPFCAHVLVRHGADGPVVGTYRLLPGDRAREAGGFIAESLFDLESLAPIRDDLVELGRACIEPRLRGGVVLMLMWSEIVRFASARRFGYLFGCASLDRSDGGANAARACRALRGHRSRDPWRVTPRVALPHVPVTGDEAPRLSPVLRGYLRAGASILGEPAWDRDFDTADLLVMLPIAGFSPRYAKRFVGTGRT